MNIDKIKDNMETRSEDYIDSESFRDNFEGSEEQLETIAQTIYDCVDCTNANADNFIDECYSMLNEDYDYLTNLQYDKVVWKIMQIMDEKGEL